MRLFALQPEAALQFYNERVIAAAGIKKSARAGRLPVLIRLVEGVDDAAAMAALREAGVDMRSRLGPIVSGEIPISNVQALAGLDAVLSIELARPVQQRLNVSVPATGASTLRTGAAPNWSGLTGKGVIVGIIDDGLDFRHRDFRNVDGTTRLLALWDQRTTGAAGQPPAGFTYGGECTPALLNAAISGAAGCTQPSSGGHGTHVGGIAAGNGSATGGGQAAYRFVGMAPQADILAANSIAASGNNTVVDAVAWMKAKAAAAGKPIVINLSLGSYYGARDGTSNYEVALSSAGAAGVVLVGAAGNEGNAPIRASGPLPQGGTLAFDVNVPAAATNVILEVWYPGTDQYAVSVKGPTCAETAQFPASAVDAGVTTPCGNINAVNAGPFATNDDRQVQVVLASGASPLAAGTWRINFFGTQVANSPATVSAVTAETASGMTIIGVNGQAPPALTTQILTDTVSAKRVIGVAAYNTNYTWMTASGQSSGAPENGAVGDLASFSSRGPRRLCSNAAKCPPVMKPEITAPGSIIMSTLASDTPPASIDAARLEIDGVHIGKEGTSMASPHVAGAVALLLQQKPTLSPEDVKQLLFANVQNTSFTPAVPIYAGTDVPANPNYVWGYGVLNVPKAVQAISAAPAAASLENPQPGSFQSGIGLLSGWSCQGPNIGIAIDGNTALKAPYGSARADTASVCGASNTSTGFGLLLNFNTLGAGVHSAQMLVNGVAQGSPTQFTVSIPAGEFLVGASKQVAVQDFPVAGKITALTWQQSQQNFVIAGVSTKSLEPLPIKAGAVSSLENPQPGSFQSGIGLLSGWSCQGPTVTMSIDGATPLSVPYGSARADTASVCGASNTNTGFGLLINFNTLGAGTHSAQLSVNGVAQGSPIPFVVTVPAGEFLVGASKQVPVSDFPVAGTTTTLTWQQSQQNFAIQSVGK